MALGQECRRSVLRLFGAAIHGCRSFRTKGLAGWCGVTEVVHHSVISYHYRWICIGAIVSAPLKSLQRGVGVSLFFLGYFFWLLLTNTKRNTTNLMVLQGRAKALGFNG